MRVREVNIHPSERECSRLSLCPASFAYGRRGGDYYGL